MPAATTKTDLIGVTIKEFDKLHSLIADISALQALQKREEDTSIKDVLSHRAHWASHYRSGAKWIRACLRADSSSPT